MSNSYSEELRELSEAAEGGDCDAGESQMHSRAARGNCYEDWRCG